MSFELIKVCENFYSQYEVQKQLFNNAATHLEALKVAPKMQRLESKKTNLDAAIAKLEKGVKEWRQNKISAPKEIDYKYEALESKKILQRAKWTRIALMACKIALGVLALVAGLSLLALGTAVYPPSLPALVLWIALGVLGVSALSAGGIGFAWGRLATSQVLRKALIIEEANFTAFVRKYIVDASTQFYPKKEDLLDPKLHGMYLDFNKAVKNLTAMKFNGRVKYLPAIPVA